jgi:hypothetical protein
MTRRERVELRVRDIIEELMSTLLRVPMWPKTSSSLRESWSSLVEWMVVVSVYKNRCVVVWLNVLFVWYKERERERDRYVWGGGGRGGQVTGER